ncbi:FKBP-type peptidyl-prolyl cis-trans isomerase [Niabella ginsengisoli]|uniref:peptidylprolyl isomerase n=1 Tax=Niabella ginsengisoli TaxID=522298 RepID=A0ABS9SHL9_9BACT|nr:FKBP-type peptidyl-prolyl cis-trans isomerase [Niabella ginsengisoli]MCH5597864.1 FKBP-type peptidyl-prolyl cis-trans isomerase [Niabella ginsengisoli]
MKRSQILGALVFATVAFTSCSNADYETTPSGLKYKIVDGGSKDSSKIGDVLKMNVIQKIEGSKDTILANTYGRLPAFVKIQDPSAMGPQGNYAPDELFKLLKKGDSLITIMYVDSLIKKGLAQEAQLPPFLKKGDKIVLTFKVVEVFKNDSLAQADEQKEMAKDAPRQQKEQMEMMEKMKKEQEAAQKADELALEKSGEKAKQIKEVQAYLASKKIAATQTPAGTFVKIDNPGTGAQVANGKFVTVKYDGKKLSNDSTFDANQFTVKLGEQPFIRGFEDGLRQFKQGGKGTIYIPGYLAYGKDGMGTFKPYEPLYFNVEITGVSDTDPGAAPQGAAGHSPNDGHGH